MNKLYDTLKSTSKVTVVTDSNTPAAISDTAQVSENRQYAQIVPEKPNVLAEERIFVYVPKVAPGSAGIAKFDIDQFNIVQDQVSIKPQLLKSTPSIVVSEDPPEFGDIWYKVIDISPSPISYEWLDGGTFDNIPSAILDGGTFDNIPTVDLIGGNY